MFKFSLIVFAAISIAYVYCQCGSRPKVRALDCCPVASSHINTDQATKCGFSLGKSKTKQPPSCDVVKCLLGQSYLLHSNQSVNRDAFAQFAYQKYPSTWGFNVTGVVQMCNARVPAISKKCEPQSYLKCFNQNIVKVCPSSLWAQNEKCAQLKTYWAQCPRKRPSQG